MDAPTCGRCGRPMRLESLFTVSHEDGDHPGTTMQLTEARAMLEAVGAWGAQVTLYVCDPCDVAEALFGHPEEDP